MSKEFDKRQLVGIILAFIGLMWLIIIPITKKTKAAKCTEVTNGYIDSCIESHIDTGLFGGSYDVTVKYFADGSPYYYHTSADGDQYAGKDVTVHYNPKKKSECYVDGVTASPLKEAIWGIIIMVVGVVEFIVTIAIRKKTSYVSLN